MFRTNFYGNTRFTKLGSLFSDISAVPTSFQVCKQTFYCNECFNSFKVSMSCKRILMFLRNNDGLIIPTVLIFLNSNDKHVKRS